MCWIRRISFVFRFSYSFRPIILLLRVIWFSSNRQRIEIFNWPVRKHTRIIVRDNTQSTRACAAHNTRQVPYRTRTVPPIQSNQQSTPPTRIEVILLSCPLLTTTIKSKPSTKNSSSVKNKELTENPYRRTKTVFVFYEPHITNTYRNAHTAIILVAKPLFFSPRHKRLKFQQYTWLGNKRIRGATIK